MACFACFPISREPKKVSQALVPMKSWVEAMQRRTTSISATTTNKKTRDVWVLCDLPDGKRVIGTKWVFRNKRDERGTIIKNKARLVAQGYRQEEGVDYDEVFAPLPELKQSDSILAFASSWALQSYQMRMSKSCQGTLWPTSSPKSMDRRDISVGTKVQETTAGIFLSQDKYVKDILNKFDFRTIKLASTPIEAHKSLGKDEEGEEVDISRSHQRNSLITSMLSKGSIGTSMIEDQLQRMSISWKKAGLLAMQETNNCGYFIYRSRWKYLVHVLLHCLSPKSTSWEQFGTNIASALVGLATNQKFNFSLMIMNGMLGHISNGTPFIMYPRFIQLFLNKQLEGVTRPTNFLPSVTLPSKVFTFMRKNSPKFSGRVTPLTPPMLEVVTALAAEEGQSASTHSQAENSPRDAQGTPTQSAAQDSSRQGTDASQGTADLQDASQTSGGDEGLLDLYALNREVRRLKKQTLSQAKQIHKLKAKLKKLSKFVQPVVKHHAFWVESQNLKKRRKKQRKKHKKKVSSVKLGRNKDEGTLSEEHHVQEDNTADFADFLFEDIVDTNAAITPDFERKSDETEALERKSDDTEQVAIEEEKGASNIKSRDT
ncbi:putative ribonuclease H-like domain-containing protein, partial [Tanacetum coccineum]